MGAKREGLATPYFFAKYFFFITKKMGKQRKYHFYFPDHATKGNYMLCKRLKVYVIKLDFCMQVNTDFTALSIRISLHCFLYFLMFSNHVFTKYSAFFVLFYYFFWLNDEILWKHLFYMNKPCFCPNFFSQIDLFWVVKYNRNIFDFMKCASIDFFKLY